MRGAGVDWRWSRGVQPATKCRTATVECGGDVKEASDAEMANAFGCSTRVHAPNAAGENRISRQTVFPGTHDERTECGKARRPLRVSDLHETHCAMSGDCCTSCSGSSPSGHFIVTLVVRQL